MKKFKILLFGSYILIISLFTYFSFSYKSSFNNINASAKEYYDDIDLLYDQQYISKDQYGYEPTIYDISSLHHRESHYNFLQQEQARKEALLKEEQRKAEEEAKRLKEAQEAEMKKKEAAEKAAEKAKQEAEAKRIAEMEQEQKRKEDALLKERQEDDFVSNKDSVDGLDGVTAKHSSNYKPANTDDGVPDESPLIYTLDQFMFMGRISWGGFTYTYYSQSVLPGGGLSIPGRHVSEDGYVCDKDDFIVLAGSAPKGSVYPTPFGKWGKIYDRGTYGNHLDVYIR